MVWGLELGRLYNRRTDIHARFGGQQQGGIITPAHYNLVVIITGEGGMQHGYADRYRDDGVFEYFGEGQVGDMVLQRGNRAIAEHSADGKSLLLFRQAKAGIRFEGEMVYDTYHFEQAPDRTGAMRNAIVFELRPLDAVTEEVESSPATGEILNIDDLRVRALAAASVGAQVQSSSRRTVYQRSQDVRAYVFARAKGTCEGCSQPAPFTRTDGTPYLEPHHLRRLSDGGPDHPAHVIALCPNCHRRVHVGADGHGYNRVLINKMALIEPRHHKLV